MKLSLFIVLFIVTGYFLAVDGVTERTRQRYASKCATLTVLGKSWGGLLNATGPTDNKTASVNVFQSVSPELYCSNFTLALPSFAIISEVEVVITRFSRMIPAFDPQAQPLTDAEIQIRDGLISDGLLTIFPNTPWTEEAAAVKFGGALALWEGGGVWKKDVAQVNSENFGVSLTVGPATINSSAYVDSVLMKVTWLEKECDDGEITGDEQCEINGIGCSSNCVCLPGYVPMVPSTKDCRPSCGDNVTNSETEECDGGYGCTAECKCASGFVPTNPISPDCTDYVPPVTEPIIDSPYYIGPTSKPSSDNRLKYPIIIAAILLSVGMLLIFLCRKKCVKLDRFGRKDADVDDDEDGMTMNDHPDGQTHEDVDLEDGDTYGADTGDDGDHHDEEHGDGGGVTLKLPIGSNQPNPDADKNV